MKSTGGRRALPRPPARCTLAVGGLLWLALAAFAGGPKQPASFAVVAGTVFQEDGHLLRGAEVTIEAAPEGHPKGKAKAITVRSDAQGEFALRVPAMAMRYTVVVRAPGFLRQEKAASVAGDERVDVFFRMEREPAGK